MTTVQSSRIRGGAAPAVALTALAATLLAACGGSGSDAPPAATTAKISGIVADGPLQGASACYDLNDNAACDSGEPTAQTDADGKYAFDVALAEVGKHAVIVAVPATAIDKDTGAAVGAAFTLKAPPTGATGAQTVFVSPLSTLVVEVAAEQGLSTEAAVARVQGQLGLTASPLADFVTTPDPQAQTMASTVNQVMIDVAKLAADANVPADQAQALVRSVSSGDLATIAALVQEAGPATPAEVAAAVSAQVLAERQLTPTTVAEQANVAANAVPAPPTEATTGPFVSIRRFSWTDANNHRVIAFVGDSTPGADGNFLVNESRVIRSNGVDAPFNRNTVYWSREKQAWLACPNQWEVIRVTPAKAATATTAATPQVSLFCGGSTTQTKVVARSVAGERMADVVASVRGSSLADSPGFDTDAAGLPKLWGPDPAALGDATFGDGAEMTIRDSINDVGDTERYGLGDKPRVVPASGSGVFRQAATFTDLKRMSGNWVDAATVVTSANTAFVDDIAFDQTDPLLADVKRYRVAFDPASDAVRFFRCDVVASTNASQNCETLGDGTSSIAAQGDGRILRLGSGYPAVLTASLKRVRLWVERDGVVFGGYKDLERRVYQHRPNTAAWEQLRAALNMTPPPAPVPPAGAGPFRVLRSFTFADAQNYNQRIFTGDNSQLDGQGQFVVNDERRIVSGGVAVPFVRNSSYWTGTEWYDCPDDGVGILTASATAPFTSVFCKSYVDERAGSTTMTLDGRNMAEVVNDIRFYPSRDGTFDYANWGPNPTVHTALAGATFPAGSTLEYRGTQRKATPIAISTAATSRVRVPPADTSAPFDTWPYATSLDEFIAKYPGDLKGGPLNGATAFFVHGYDLPAPPAPEYTTRVEIRVAFDAVGSKARFWRNYRAAATGFTTAYTVLLDTTYSVETLGGVPVLKFTAMPAGFEDEFLFQRMFAQRNGSVWYAFKDSVPATPARQIRLNGTAMDALNSALGIATN